MTVQDIITQSRAKKKLQAGGQATGTVEGIQDDLAKKTIRDDTMVTNTQNVAGGAPSPSLAATTQRKGLAPTGGQEPMHVIIDNADDMGGGGGGGLTGMVNKFAGNMLGKGLGAVGGLFNKIKNRNHPVPAPTQPQVPIGKEGGSIHDILNKYKKIPKAQTGGQTSDRAVNAIKAVGLSNIKPLNLSGMHQSPGLQPMAQQNLGFDAQPGTQRKTFSNSETPGVSPQGAPADSPFAGKLAGGITGAGSLVSGAMDSLKPKGPMNTWGIETQTKKGNRMSIAGGAAGGAAKGAAAMASTGTPFLIAGGAVVGGLVGLFGAKKKVKQEAKEIKDSTQLAYEGYNQKANAAQYAALGKHGAKLAVMRKIDSSKKDKISMKGRKFKMKSGGKLDALGGVNIIPSGTLHKENNNLGQKDKGIPIIDKGGKKVFEVEREEIIFRLKATKSIEDLTDKYKKSHNDRHLIELGKLLSTEINDNTHDFSGRYGLEV